MLKLISAKTRAFSIFALSAMILALAISSPHNHGVGDLSTDNLSHNAESCSTCLFQPISEGSTPAAITPELVLVFSKVEEIFPTSERTATLEYFSENQPRAPPIA